MMPSLFIAHGSPMVAIEDNEYARFLEQLGGLLPRPKAIAIFTAHWESTVQTVSDRASHKMIYDFGGFPDELYRIVYPACGDRELAGRILELLHGAGFAAEADTERGIDHGVWTILRRIYPDADIPVIALSVNADLAPEAQYRIGKSLAPLRKDGVLIIGSGVTVHNFGLFRARSNPEVVRAVLAFEDWLEGRLHAWDTEALFHYASTAPHAQLAVPPGGSEHFAPLFYAMGAADGEPRTATLHRSTQFDVMTNSVYKFGG